MKSPFRKLLLSLCCVAGCTAATMAQTFTNGGMETWTNYNVGLFPPVALEKPASWYSSDSLAAVFVPIASGFSAQGKKQLFKSTDSHAGTYAAMLMTRDQELSTLSGIMSNGKMSFILEDTSFRISGGAPVTQRVDSAIAWLKYSPANDLDEGYFEAEAVRAGEASDGTDSVIGYGFAFVSQGSEYSRYAIPVEYINSTQVPTHFRVNFYSSAEFFGGPDSSKLYVDDASYKLGSTSVSLMSFEQQEVRVFPNPAREVLSLHSALPGQLRFEAYSVTGQRVAAQDFSGSATVPLQSLPAGLYAYRILGKEGAVQQGTFCVE